MSPLTIPLHLLIATIISLSGLIFLLLKRTTLRRKNPALYKSGLIFFFAYALIVGNALGHDVYYQWNVNRHDLDQDGIFDNPSETTPDQARAMERLLDDTGRDLSFVNGLLVSLVLSISVYGAMRINHFLFGPEDNEDTTNQLKNIQPY